jgi:membrane-associated phospholipid phosphatase
MKKVVAGLLIFCSLHQGLQAQAPVAGRPLIPNGPLDSAGYVDEAGFRTRLWPSMIIPAALVGYGLLVYGDHPYVYNDIDARNDVKSLAKYGSDIDDYLIFSPYVEFGLLLAFQVKCKNDMLNTGLIILKTEAIMLAATFGLKNLVGRERPYHYGQRVEGESPTGNHAGGDAFVSMPSGHTAQAFAAATIVHREYRHKSPWYGAGAYALATSVALFRMINDQHWQSDVLIGAGIGMASANLVYATHLHRWGRKEVCITPTFNNYSKGIAMSVTF